MTKPRYNADGLEERLTDLGRAISYPAAPHLASQVADRLAATAARPGRPAGWPLRASALRRAALAAVALLLVLATVVAAAVWLVPGIRLVLLPGGATLPAATSTADMPIEAGLGDPVALAAAAERAGFEPLDVDVTEYGPPDRAFVRDAVVTYVWASDATLPATRAPGVGLLVTQLEGRVEDAWYEKQIVDGTATVEPVQVGTSPARWVSGQPHSLVYIDVDGEAVEETRRVVGDVLIWRSDYGITVRIESTLGRDATVRLAEAIQAAN